MIPALAVVSTAPFFLRPSSTTPRCGNTQSPKQALRESTGADHITAKDSLRHTRSSGTKNVPTLGLLPMPIFKGMCSPLVQYEHLAHKNKSIPTSPTSSMGHLSGASCFRAGLWVRPVEPSHQSRTRRGRLAHHWSENMDKHCASFTMGNTSCPH